MTETLELQTETLPAAIMAAGSDSMPYAQVEGMLRHTAISPALGVQITTQIKRVAVAVGALAGRALGAHDFVYSFDRRLEGSRRLLHMTIHSVRESKYLPRAQMILELTSEGHVYRLCELQISQPSLPLMNTGR